MTPASDATGGRRSPASAEVLAHLADITESPGFRSAPRKAQLLRYLVERALAGAAVTEYAIAVDVFERPASFSPSEDSIVRTEATRLRQKLAEYYSRKQPAGEIRIELPVRTYTPLFVASAPAERAAGTPEAGPGSRWGRRGKMWVAAATIALIGSGVLLAWRTLDPRPEIPTIAVLPFLNLTGDSGLEYLSDGITEDLTEAIAENPGIRVVARTSAYQFKGKMQDVREIGRRLNAAALVEGSLRRQDGELKAVVQLIAAKSALHIWSGSFEIPNGELRGVEAEIAGSTQRALLPRSAAPAPGPRTSANAEAHDLYLRAAYQFSHGDADALRKALGLARQAVKLDPAFVRAHWLIVKAEENLANAGLESVADADRNTAESLKTVLALDPASPDAHAQVAYRTYVREWNWPAAEKEFRIAIAAGRSAANAFNLYGWSLVTRGRFAEAHAMFDSALEIDPLAQNGARPNNTIAWLMQRKYNKARQTAESILQLNANSAMARGLLSWIAVAEGDCAAVREAQKNFLVLAPNTSGSFWEARCGSAADARRLLDQALKPDRKTYISSYVLAEVYAMLGDAGATVECLNRTAAEKADVILYIQLDPTLDGVRMDPRVQALAEKIGLPAAARADERPSAAR